MGKKIYYKPIKIDSQQTKESSLSYFKNSLKESGAEMTLSNFLYELTERVLCDGEKLSSYLPKNDGGMTEADEEIIKALFTKKFPRIAVKDAAKAYHQHFSNFALAVIDQSNLELLEKSEKIHCNRQANLRLINDKLVIESICYNFQIKRGKEIIHEFPGYISSRFVLKRGWFFSNWRFERKYYFKLAFMECSNELMCDLLMKPIQKVNMSSQEIADAMEEDNKFLTYVKSRIKKDPQSIAALACIQNIKPHSPNTIGKKADEGVDFSERKVQFSTSPITTQPDLTIQKPKEPLKSILKRNGSKDNSKKDTSNWFKEHPFSTFIIAGLVVAAAVLLGALIIVGLAASVPVLLPAAGIITLVAGAAYGVLLGFKIAGAAASAILLGAHFGAGALLGGGTAATVKLASLAISGMRLLAKSVAHLFGQVATPSTPPAAQAAAPAMTSSTAATQAALKATQSTDPEKVSSVVETTQPVETTSADSISSQHPDKQKYSLLSIFKEQVINVRDRLSPRVNLP